MATVLIELAGLSTSFTMDDNDANRILAAYTATYTTQDEEGNDVVPTPTETVNQLAQGVVDGLAANAVRWEQTEASKTAVGNVPNIVATIN
jgi:hypothetical protein